MTDEHTAPLLTAAELAEGRRRVRQLAEGYTTVRKNVASDWLIAHAEALIEAGEQLAAILAALGVTEPSEGVAVARHWGSIRREVRVFALAMEERLRANEHKGGWQVEAPTWLLGRCREEVDELESATYADADNILQEAADVGNFAMMVADVAGALTSAEEAALAADQDQPPKRITARVVSRRLRPPMVIEDDAESAAEQGGRMTEQRPPYQAGEIPCDTCEKWRCPRRSEDRDSRQTCSEWAPLSDDVEAPQTAGVLLTQERMRVSSLKRDLERAVESEAQARSERDEARRERDQAIRERDEARKGLALFKDEHRAMWSKRDRMEALYVDAEAENEHLRAQVERWRPVVEAAQAWIEHPYLSEQAAAALCRMSVALASLSSSIAEQRAAEVWRAEREVLTKARRLHAVWDCGKDDDREAVGEGVANAVNVLVRAAKAAGIANESPVDRQQSPTSEPPQQAAEEGEGNATTS